MQIKVGHFHQWNGTQCHQHLCYVNCQKSEIWRVILCLKVTETAERIDMEKLKAREQIMFFDDVLLFEDELHDHGVSMISVKIVSGVFMSTADTFNSNKEQIL